ncbi:MAG: hypothetical protein HPY51_09575 [Candidatus Omnitrophica bacterium]|nr:hypothetical protein [Candidatus Omnitrophota bacterium]
MRKKHEVESGAVLVLVAICMSLFFILLAVAIDIGYMHATKAELQHAADAAALAGAIELAEAAPDPVGRAQEYGGYNEAAKVALTEMPESDVIVGYMENPLDIHAEIDTESEDDPNSVEAVTRRTTDVNGPLQLFLGAFTGLDEVNIAAKGRAVYTRKIGGFMPDAPGGTEGGGGGIPNVMPFAIHIDLWKKMLEGPVDGSKVFDDYSYDEKQPVGPSRVVEGKTDDKFEIKMYPNDKDESSPGNYGTVDIGNPNNSVPDIRDQIRNGISEEDVEYIGGSLDVVDNFELDGTTPCNCLWLEADPGISAGFKDALEDEIGVPKVILLFDDMLYDDGGNTSAYRIIGFGAVVILEVKMTGNPKYVRIQPTGEINLGGDSDHWGTPIFNPDSPESENMYMTGLTR